MFVSVLSGGLTVFTILMGVAVIHQWYKPAVNAAKDPAPLTPEQWFILGVFIAFVGQVFDNSYWLVAWTFDYFNESAAITQWLFENGLIVNIPFRQIVGIVAAYCHIKAAVGAYTIKTIRFRAYMFTSAVAGVLFSMWMVFAKSHYPISVV